MRATPAFNGLNKKHNFYDCICLKYQTHFQIKEFRYIDQKEGLSHEFRVFFY